MLKKFLSNSKKLVSWFVSGLLLKDIHDKKICGFYASFYAFIFVSYFGIFLLLTPAFLMVFKTNYLLESQLWNLMILLTISNLILIYLTFNSIRKYFKMKGKEKATS